MYLISLAIKLTSSLLLLLKVVEIASPGFTIKDNGLDLIVKNWSKSGSKYVRLISAGSASICPKSGLIVISNEEWVFIPNFKIIITGHGCREREKRDGRLENANVFWDLENTLTLIPLFNQCYDIFVANLKEDREPFDGVDDILSNSDIRNLRNSSVPATNKSWYLQQANLLPTPTTQHEPEKGGVTYTLSNKKNLMGRKKRKSRKNIKRKSKKRKAKKTKNNYKKSKKTRRKIKKKI